MVTDLLLPKRGIAVPKPPSYIRGDWRFSEGSGLFLGDHSRYRNHGTIHGATWSTDRKPGCLDFDGDNDYVDCGKAASLDITTAITLEAWIYPHTVGNNRIIHKGLATPDEIYCMLFRAPPYLWFRLTDSGGTEHNLFPTDKTFALNTWHHIMMTYDGNKMRIFANGELSTEGSEDIFTIGTSTNILNIGRHGNSSEYFNGLIAGVRVLGIARSASGAKARYNATK